MIQIRYQLLGCLFTFFISFQPGSVICGSAALLLRSPIDSCPHMCYEGSHGVGECPSALSDCGGLSWFILSTKLDLESANRQASEQSSEGFQIPQVGSQHLSVTAQQLKVGGGKRRFCPPPFTLTGNFLPLAVSLLQCFC